MLTISKKQTTPQGEVLRGVQFLSPKHILDRKKGEIFTVTKVTTNKPDNFGNPYVVYFSKGGQKYSKGLKPTSEGLSQLGEFLGAEESKWVGKKVNINVRIDEDESERLTYSVEK